MIYSALHRLRISHFIGKKFLTEKFSPFRLFYRGVKLLNFTRRVKRNDSRFIVPVKNGMGLMNLISDYETWLDGLLPALIRPGSAFIDVGANTGQTLLKVVPRFPSVRYYAVEPNPSCIDYLNALCEINSFNTVKVMNHALSDATGVTELLLRYQDDILATTSPSFRKFTRYSSSVKVPVTTGDALFHAENVNDLSVIKIDVEGGEAKVIAGLRETIRSCQPYILCEILPLASRDTGVTQFRTSSAQFILDLLDDLNYQIFNIINGNAVHSIHDLSTSMESSNYLFIPEGKDCPLNL